MTPTSSSKRYVSRLAAQTCVCPQCGAGRGQSCLRKNGDERLSCHAARHRAFVRWRRRVDAAR